MKNLITKVWQLFCVLVITGYSLDAAKPNMARDGTLSLEQFCIAVPGWRGINIPRDVNLQNAFHNIGNIVSSEFVLQHYQEPGWIILDVRSKKARSNAGTFVYTAFVPAENRSVSADGFRQNSISESKKYILESINKAQKYMDKRIKRGAFPYYKNIAEPNYIIFCNGPTCHKTSWAACQLRSLGVPKEKINVFLHGFSILDRQPPIDNKQFLK